MVNYLINTEVYIIVIDNKERSLYLRTLSKTFYQYIVAQSRQLRMDHITRLASKNQLLLQCATATFIFKNNWYPEIAVLPVDGTKCNTKIHPSLYTEIATIIELVDFVETVREKHIQHFINNCLMFAQHIDDLYLLLPEYFTQVINAVSSDIFNIADPISKNKIHDFLQNEKTGLSAIGQLFITQLLTQKN